MTLAGGEKGPVLAAQWLRPHDRRVVRVRPTLPEE